MSDYQKVDYDSYTNWHELGKETIPQIQKLITGNKEIWEPTAITPSFTGDSALDFGCGLGRNAPVLFKEFTRVIGYDLPVMIKKLKTLPKIYDLVSHDLPAVLSRENITHIHECVVWQHLTWSSNIIQNVIDLLTKTPSITTVYSVWNSAVNHQKDFKEYFLNSGWKLVETDQLTTSQLSSLAGPNIAHTWYLFIKN